MPATAAVIRQEPVGTPAASIAFVSDADSQRAVRSYFEDEGVPAANVHRGTVQDAVKHLARSVSPRRIVVDISGADMPLSALEELANVCEPGTAVVVVGEKNDIPLYRELMRAGVTDYLVKPITPDLLATSFGRANAPREDDAAARRGRVIAVIGSRGGAGTSTVAVNLAWILAETRRRRVALVDFDLHFGTTALMLDVESRHELRRALEDPGRVDSLFIERVMVRCTDRLAVLSAEENPADAVTVDPVAVERLFDEIRNKFNYIVVDLPRSMDGLVRKTLQAAAHVVVVSDPSLAGVRDCQRLVGFVSEINPAGRITVIGNRFDEHEGGEVSKRDMEQAIARPVDLALPYDRRRVALAATKGVPVASEGGPVATGLTKLVDRIVAAQTPEKKRGLLSRLLAA